MKDQKPWTAPAVLYCVSHVRNVRVRRIRVRVRVGVGVKYYCNCVDGGFVVVYEQCVSLVVASGRVGVVQCQINFNLQFICFICLESEFRVRVRV